MTLKVKEDRPPAAAPAADEYTAVAKARTCTPYIRGTQAGSRSPAPRRQRASLGCISTFGSRRFECAYGRPRSITPAAATTADEWARPVHPAPAPAQARALGRPLLASPAAPASEPGVVRHLRLTELSMYSSPPCDKQRHARDENRERQQRRQTVCASSRGHLHGVPRAPMDRPSGYSSPMDPSHHPGSSGARPGVVPRCLTVRVGAPQISALRHLRRLRTAGRLVAHSWV